MGTATVVEPESEIEPSSNSTPVISHRPTAWQRRSPIASSGVVGKDEGEVCHVLVSIIQADFTYQRYPSKQRIKKFAAEWDTLVLGFPLVNQRADGSIWAIDGWHRISAAKLRGNTTIRCELLRGLTQDEESRVYSQRNSSSKKLHATEAFKAKLAFDDAAAVEIVHIATQHGLKIATSSSGGSPNDKTIKAVICVEGIYGLSGAEMLDRILRVVLAAWPNEKSSETLHQTVLSGLHGFFRRYAKHSIDEKRLTTVLSKKSPMDIVRAANSQADYSMGGGSEKYAAQVIRNLYSARLRNPLPEW